MKFYNDPEAVRKIKEKIEDLRKSNEYSKKLNKILSKFDTISEALAALSALSDDDSKFLVKTLKDREHWYNSKVETIKTKKDKESINYRLGI